MRRMLLPALLLACTPAEEIEPDSSGGADPPAAGAPTESVRGRDGVEYRASTAVLESFPVQLHTTVEATNRADEPVTLTFPDGCTVLLRAYAEQDAGAGPAWDQAGATACTMALVEITLQPRESRSFEARASARDILGDSLADASYRIAAYLRPTSGTIEVPAGTVPLAVSRDGAHH